jgi:hypothetical protein
MGSNRLLLIKKTLKKIDQVRNSRPLSNLPGILKGLTDLGDAKRRDTTISSKTQSCYETLMLLSATTAIIVTGFPIKARKRSEKNMV